MNRIIAEDVEEIVSGTIPFEKLFGKTILISGANGYVPAYFVHTFLALNDRKNANITVLALCRNEVRAKKRFLEYAGRDDFRLIIQDVRDPIAVDETVHVFIHAASPGPASIKDMTIR